MEKSYVCNRFPYIKIGESIEFYCGEYTTDKPELQGVIESNEWYGVFIHPKEHYPAAAAEAPAPKDDVASVEAAVVAGLRGSRKGRI